MAEDLVKQISDRDFDAEMANNLAEIVRISVQAGKDEAAASLVAKDAEIERLRSERDKWDRRVAYDELRVREHENRATQQRQIDQLSARAEQAEHALKSEKEESASYHKFWIEERDKRIAIERTLAEAREALLTAARRFELMAAGGVECTNGACPKAGHSEANEAAARAFVAQRGVE